MTVSLLRPSLAFEKAILAYKSEFGESNQLINGDRNVTHCNNDYRVAN